MPFLGASAPSGHLTSSLMRRNFRRLVEVGSLRLVEASTNERPPVRRYLAADGTPRPRRDILPWAWERKKTLWKDRLGDKEVQVLNETPRSLKREYINV